MSKKQIKILDDKVRQDFLPFVRRPSRYIGGEVNHIKKNLNTCDLTVALCFPDVYEIGMSHMGLAIIYDILNSKDSIAAERVYAPWIDAEDIMRKNNIPLFSLESKAAVSDFDVVGFSLTNELCYTNVLNMLDLAGLKIRSCDRSEDDPLIIAGGVMANCCEPIADFLDLIIIGEGEDAVTELAGFLLEEKHKGSSKKNILSKAAKKFEWAYVPSLYEHKYKDGNFVSIEPVIEGISIKRKTTVVQDFDNAPVPQKPIVPFTQAVHERVSIEIMRGCPGRCRFCQASFCKRPIRYRSIDKIVEIAKQQYQATGFDTVSLLSLSTADYPELEQLVAKLNEYFRDKHVGISVPSLRVDSQLKIVPQLVKSVRKSGLTIAVEAASERLRKIINKPLKDADLFAAVEAAYRAGWQKLKLYFMAGLPGETTDDIKRIVSLAKNLARLRRKVDGKTANINVAVSWFVPKAHTPFQWFGQRSKEYFENARQIILDEKRELKAGFLQFKFHNIERSLLESAIGRSDRRLANVIETAWKDNARFDLWDDCFDNKIWLSAFSKNGFDIEQLSTRKFSKDELLPWAHLGGPEEKDLQRHYDDTRSQMDIPCDD